MGVLVVASSAAVAVVTAFLLRGRLPAGVTVPLMIAASAALAWGALLLRERPSSAEWIVAVAAMAVLGPLHVRIVLGPYRARS